MKILFLILIILQCIGIGVLLTWTNDLHRKIQKLENKIGFIQYQLDDILCDVNIVNKNILNTYGMLSEMKQNQNEND